MALRLILHSNNPFSTLQLSRASLSFRTISSSSRCPRLPFSPPSEAPPSPKKLPFTVSVHGKTWQDPYHWMSNTQDPDLLDHLNRESTYADAFMADTLNLRSSLSSEMRSRIPPTISTPPERWGPWLYYQYIPEGKEYPVLCRRRETERTGWLKAFVPFTIPRSTREEILLDWNEIAEKYGYVHVGTCRVSPDHNYLAYTLDISGGERFMLQVKDLRSGFVDPKLGVEGVVSLAWVQDGSSLFYTLVFCRKLGNNHVNDLPVFTESDPSFCVDITSTKDGKFITVYVINAAKPMDGLQRICKRASGVQYFVEHHYGLFYILTNAPMPEGKWYGEDYYLVRCRVEDIESDKWQNTIVPGKDMSICDMDIFNGHLVLLLSKRGLPALCSLNLPIQNDCKHQIDIEDLKPWYFPLPSNACSAVPGSNHDFLKTVYRVVLSSPVMPDVIVDYDMSRHTYSIVHQEEVNGVSAGQSCIPNFGSHEDIHEPHNVRTNSGSQTWKDFSHVYCCQREEVISHDGVKVPLTIVYSRESWKKGQSPGILQGYGAYGEVLDKSWCSDRLSLLDRGWVVAFADVRGGGGGVDSSWHKSGSGLNKHNSIYDFVSCANYLVNEGYVHRDQLGAIGWSAGCLLLGAAMNMYPDLFRASILKVPFLDICNTLLDPSLPLTILDYEEFGNPQIKSHFDSIFTYSPYDNIPQGKCFSSVLVTAALNDSRVGVWEGAKWVAKVRDSTCSNCSRAVIMKTNMIGGHFGEGGHYGQCDETAYDYAFLMKAFGFLNN
ncbi:prolyl oligopeptidase family protein [Senna tora]|uniref:Prolyl endopeptidase n=1 Tax=Senna tora TaxID=362788 RepID=A0A834WM06_9FABA|nr:prolyl oligopeptidase family protein [Senna tora]